MKSLYKDGWQWLVSYDWRSLNKIQGLWFGNQIDRFIAKFNLSVDEGKRLRAEIAEKGLR